ncbi:MAG: toxin-antitoxin system YwqK family antitoxin [Chloroflexota bacterium]
MPEHSPGMLDYVCRLNGVEGGTRRRTTDGRLLHEAAYRDGKLNGWLRDWDQDGRLAFEGFRIDFLEHGICRQWHEGRLIGWYIMDRGTGLDLWRNADGMLSEERYLKDGGLHGYTRWWSTPDNRTIWWEEHFQDNVQHGIERQWNGEGRVKRGYPRYFVHGQRVTKRQYLSACKKDPTLPPYRPEDDRPERPLPPEYVQTMPPAVPPTMPADPTEWRPSAS